MENTTIYFNGPGGSWVGHKFGGTWKYSSFDHSSEWLQRQQFEEKYPGFYAPNPHSDD